jgi:hypothetical protein
MSPQYRAIILLLTCLAGLALPRASAPAGPAVSERSVAAADPSGAASLQRVLRARILAYLEGGPGGSSSGGDPFLERTPLPTRFALEVSEGSVGEAFLRGVYPRLAAAFERRMTLLDSNGNGLPETVVTEGSNGTPRRVDSARLSALAADEMRSLARLAHRLGANEDALDWLSRFRRYREVVSESFYDFSINGFQDRDSGTAEPVPGYRPGSYLPLWIGFDPGEPRVLTIVRTRLHLVGFVYAPGGAPGSTQTTTEVDPHALADAIFLLRWLERVGQDERAATFRRSLVAALARHGRRERDAPTGERADPWTEYLLLTLERWPEPDRDPLVANRSLLGLATARDLLPREDVGRWQLGIDKLDHLLAPGGDPRDGLVASREVLRSLSLLRHLEELHSGRRPRDGSETMPAGWPALDRIADRRLREGLEIALEEILEARSALGARRLDELGLEVRLVLRRESLATDEPLPLTLAVRALSRPVTVSRLALRALGREYGLEPPGELVPGEPPEPLALRVPVSDQEPGLGLLRFEIVLGLENDLVPRIESRAVRISAPLDAKLSLERAPGSPDTCLVVLGLRNHGSATRIGETEISLDADWKLLPAPGHRFRIPPGGAPLRIVYRFRLPYGVRPGRYGIQGRVTLEGKPAAVVGTDLFVPFEWIVLGPSEPEPLPAARLLDPESPIDLRRTYDGFRGLPLRWRPVRPSVLPLDGVVDLGSLLCRDLPPALGQRVRAHAYTVVEVEKARDVTAVLETPAEGRVWHNRRAAPEAAPNGEARTEDGVWRRSLTPVTLQPGRNTFLVELTGRPDRLRFRFELLEEGGLPLEGASNELARLLEGSTDLRQTGMKTGPKLPVPVTLEYEDPSARSVSVIGSFNAWSSTALPMEKMRDGHWRATFRLPEGTYSYRFLVDGKREVVDPRAEQRTTDGYGGTHGLLVVRRR